MEYKKQDNFLLYVRSRSNNIPSSDQDFFDYIERSETNLEEYIHIVSQYCLSSTEAHNSHALYGSLMRIFEHAMRIDLQEKILNILLSETSKSLEARQVLVENGFIQFFNQICNTQHPSFSFVGLVDVLHNIFLTDDYMYAFNEIDFDLLYRLCDYQIIPQFNRSVSELLLVVTSYSLLPEIVSSIQVFFSIIPNSYTSLILSNLAKTKSLNFNDEKVIEFVSNHFSEFPQELLIVGSFVQSFRIPLDFLLSQAENKIDIPQTLFAITMEVKKGIQNQELHRILEVVSQFLNNEIFGIRNIAFSLFCISIIHFPQSVYDYFGYDFIISQFDDFIESTSSPLTANEAILALTTAIQGTEFYNDLIGKSYTVEALKKA